MERSSAHFVLKLHGDAFEAVKEEQKLYKEKTKRHMSYNRVVSKLLAAYKQLVARIAELESENLRLRSFRGSLN